MSTLHYRTARFEREADPADELFSGPAVFVFWHEYIPFPFYTRPNCRLAILASQHQDAEVLSHIARFAGLAVVRGSTNRGGTQAIREMLRRGKGMSLAITPDGPRGPRRRLAQGCIYVASRLQIPIIPLGIGYDRPWRNRKAWDQFAIPRPYSRCRSVLGPRIQVPPNISRDQMEIHRLHIQRWLAELSDLADDWAHNRCTLNEDENLYPSSPRAQMPAMYLKS